MHFVVHFHLKWNQKEICITWSFIIRIFGFSIESCIGVFVWVLNLKFLMNILVNLFGLSDGCFLMNCGKGNISSLPYIDFIETKRSAFFSFSYFDVLWIQKSHKTPFDPFLYLLSKKQPLKIRWFNPKTIRNFCFY